MVINMMKYNDILVSNCNKLKISTFIEDGKNVNDNSEEVSM